MRNKESTQSHKGHSIIHNTLDELLARADAKLKSLKWMTDSEIIKSFRTKKESVQFPVVSVSKIGSAPSQGPQNYVESKLHAAGLNGKKKYASRSPSNQDIMRESSAKIARTKSDAPQLKEVPASFEVNEYENVPENRRPQDPISNTVLLSSQMKSPLKIRPYDFSKIYYQIDDIASDDYRSQYGLTEEDVSINMSLPFSPITMSQSFSNPLANDMLQNMGLRDSFERGDLSSQNNDNDTGDANTADYFNSIGIAQYSCSDSMEENKFTQDLRDFPEQVEAKQQGDEITDDRNATVKQLDQTENKADGQASIQDIKHGNLDSTKRVSLEYIHYPPNSGVKESKLGTKNIGGLSSVPVAKDRATSLRPLTREVIKRKGNVPVEKMLNGAKIKSSTRLWNYLCHVDLHSEKWLHRKKCTKEQLIAMQELHSLLADNIEELRANSSESFDQKRDDEIKEKARAIIFMREAQQRAVAEEMKRQNELEGNCDNMEATKNVVEESGIWSLIASVGFGTDCLGSALSPSTPLSSDFQVCNDQRPASSRLERSFNPMLFDAKGRLQQDFKSRFEYQNGKLRIKKEPFEVPTKTSKNSQSVVSVTNFLNYTGPIPESLPNLKMPQPTPIPASGISRQTQGLSRPRSRQDCNNSSPSYNSNGSRLHFTSNFSQSTPYPSQEKTEVVDMSCPVADEMAALQGVLKQGVFISTPLNKYGKIIRPFPFNSMNLGNTENIIRRAEENLFSSSDLFCSSDLFSGVDNLFKGGIIETDRNKVRKKSTDLEGSYRVISHPERSGLQLPVDFNPWKGMEGTFIFFDISALNIVRR